MGKIVKHCAACDESFAEKFGFCPNCGSALQAFEMNPLKSESAAIDSSKNGTSNSSGFEAKTVVPFEAKTIAPVETKTFNLEEKQSLPKETPAEKTVEKEMAAAKTESVQTEKPVEKTAPVLAAAATTNGNGYGQPASDYNFQPRAATNTFADRNDGYHITVIEEKNVKQRNLLLLGSMLFMISLALGGTIYSLFNKDLLVGAIDEGNPLYVLPVDDAPMDVEEEIEKPKNDDDAGGGGGGGREKPTPTSKGQLATQTEKPMLSPTVTLVKKDFELQYQASTQGKKNIKQTDEPYGDPNSKYTLSSDGMGSGGGQGSGVGTGQGSGRGTGAGTGIGSGFGGGNGDGEGNGRGSGRQGAGAPPPPPPTEPKPVGPTEGVKILSKPKALYTDAARQNQVQGTVTLRVTFTANGSIGSISPVSSLPYGLTEQAIAAARGIKFEPAKKGGVPYTVTKQVQYSFTIY